MSNTSLTTHPDGGTFPVSPEESAMMPGMPADTPAHARKGPLDRLTEGMRWWLVLAVAATIAGMGGGFWLSFQNLSRAAARNGWHTPWLFPLIIDSGVPTYVIVDHLLVMLGCKKWFARLTGWFFAGLTVYFNGALTSATSMPWRIAAAAAPSVWVLGIEALRLLWHVLASEKPAARADGIPLARWVANPFTALVLWYRKQILGITSWTLLLAVEDARVFLRDAITAVRVKQPGLTVPPSVRRACRSGRFPGEVRAALETGPAAHWEPVLGEWFVQRMGLAERLSEAISNPAQARSQTGSQTPAIEGSGEGSQTQVPDGSETRSETSRETRSQTPVRARSQTQSADRSEPRSQTPATRLTAARSKSMSGQDLVPHVEALWSKEDLGKMAATAALQIVMTRLHIGKPKATEAIKAMKARRVVLPMHPRESLA